MSSSDPFTTPPRHPRLRVDTGLSDDNLTLQIPVNTVSFNSPPVSPALDPSSPIAQVLQSKSTVDQKRNEFRKVIELLIHNLNTRKRPPSAFEEFRRSTSGKETHGVASVLQAVRGVVKIGKKEGLADIARSMHAESTQEQDNDELDDGSFSTDNTVDHLIQLRDVLIMSAQLGWNILTPRMPNSPSFQTPSSPLEPPSPKSPFRRRRQSLRRSPSRERRNLHDQEILDQIITIVSEIIAEDCRFKVKLVRLSKPPNSLQSVSLDVAQCLIQSQRSDPKTVADIAFAVLPAFTTFPPEMHPRLIAFFEDHLVRPALDSLEVARNHKPPSKGPPLKGLGISAPSEMIGSPPRRPSSANPLNPAVVSIKVDEAQDDGLPSRPGWIQWSASGANTPSISTTPNILSTFAPSQSTKIYVHSALIPPLLVALLSSIEFPSLNTSVHTVHRIHRLIQCIVALKPDCYLDFLEIVAYHTDRVRWSALAIMTSMWPGALGHAFIGKAFPIVDHSVDMTLRDSNKRLSRWIQDESAYRHEFIPWCFSTSSESKSVPDTCHVCSRTLDDFGLLCVMCTCSVHLGCYEPPDHGNIMITYPLPHDPNTQKFASIRFSYVLPHHRSLKPPPTIQNRHYFRLINLFTLSCCIACKEPLWGTTKQAMECSGCSQLVHEKCLSHSDLPYCGAPQSASFTITSSELRKSFREHYQDIIFDSREELMKQTYEDVSVCYGILWTQLAILDSGVNSGSLSIMKDSNTRWIGMDDVISEIQKIIKMYEEHMISMQTQKSDTLEEFERLGSSGGSPFEDQATSTPKSILFNWSLVSYITALLKSPLSQAANSGGAGSETPFLRVSGEYGLAEPSEANDPPPPEASHPFEIVVLSHMRDVLGFELNVFSDAAARYLLSHIHSCKFFHRLDHQHHLFHSSASPSFDAFQIDCAFPLPLIIDYSTSVETLVSAISACLEDLDIALNEVGFLWLMKRCWPSGLTSDYAAHRLAGIVVAWIVSEDDRLLRIARDFVARGILLPGVRATNEISEGGPWPSQSNQQNLRGVPQSTTSRSGGEYLACRKQLLARYGAKWMEALWRQDEELYVVALYDHCSVLARDEDKDELMETLEGKEPDTISEDVILQRKIAKADKTLRNFIKLSQSSIVYSGFARMLGSWLDSVAQFSGGDRVASFPSLLRLFTKEDSSRRSAVVTSANVMDNLAGSDNAPDPWNVIVSVASEGPEGLIRSISWLRVLAQSSVDIPISTFQEMSGLCKTHQVGFATVVSLTEAIFCNAWLYTVARSKLIGLIGELHARYSGWISVSFDHQDRVDLIHRFLKFTLATVLLLYGCNRDLVTSMGMIDAGYVAGLSAVRSRASMRMSMTPMSLSLEIELINAVSKYVVKGTEMASGYAIKFLSILFTEPSWLAQDGATTFLSNGEHILFESIWRAFDLEDHDIRNPRMNFFLRLLSNNSAAFEEMMGNIFDKETQWTLRFDAVNKLFHIILDLNDPVFALEGRRSCVLPVFTYFFQSIYEDSREEVRLSAETLAQTLLPAHFYTITHCWDDSFPELNEEKKLKLINFLIQILPHFPKWRVLSWGTIVQAMMEDDSIKSKAATPLTPHNNAADDFIPSTQLIALVCLSLNMIGNGIPADVHVLLRIKLCLATVLGYSQAELVPNFNGTHFVRFGRMKSIPKSSQICLRNMVRAMDASTPALLLPAAMGVLGDVDSPSPNPIGAIFIDLVLSLLGSADFRRLPYSVARALLDALITTVYKYDITRKSLQHLQDGLASAVEGATQIVKLDISYDLRSAAFTAAHGLLKLFPNLVIKILG
ncbi:hypothetical protein FRC03_001535 [Tulasnella sp. 419]|nr:hypothetical protein FRC03_001535 [Tulasnella sp. 419]